jgi:predicted RNase H-like nuclease
MLSEEGHWEADVFENISGLWERCGGAALLLIDIPIGLPDKGPLERACDREARHVLGRRRSSVFRVPCRAATQARSYEQAKQADKDRTGKKLSIQVWRIVPKIRDVDEFLAGNGWARGRIRETHPELCFWALNGGRAMAFNKKTEQGFQERMDVLRRVCQETEQIVSYAMTKFEGKVRRDDILDALGAAVTAFSGKDKLRSIPEKPQQDSRGLPMEMVYHLLL